MQRFVLMLSVLSIMVGSAAAQGPPPGWHAVQRLRRGTKITVERPLASGELDEQRSCKIVRVDAATLTCIPEGDQGQRVVYPARQIDSVYRIKRDVPWVRLVLGAGLGFAIGGAVSDGRPNFPLAGVGAIAGAGYAVGTDTPKTKVVLVYPRMPEPATSNNDR
jgi:hypothetical protein